MHHQILHRVHLAVGGMGRIQAGLEFAGRKRGKNPGHHTVHEGSMFNARRVAGAARVLRQVWHLQHHLAESDPFALILD